VTADPVEAANLESVRRRWKVPALAAGLVHADGGLELAAVGERRRGHPDEPVREDDPWHVGSCAKAMTAVALARLVERGDLGWDSPLTELFADLDADVAWQRVTLDEVLRHRGGVPANLDAAHMRAAWADTRPLTEQRTEAVARVLAAPPVRRGRFVYSNLGYVTAGAVVERVTGLAYERAVAELVCEPLGITSQGFGAPAGIRGHRGLVSLAGIGLGRGPALDPTEPSSDNPLLLGPAGTLHLTVADWARFLRLFLRGGDGPELVSPASLDRILGADAEPGQHGMGWAPAGPLPGVSFGQQGSSTAWVATALLDGARERAAVVLVNDGRTAMLRRTALHAAHLLRPPA